MRSLLLAILLVTGCVDPEGFDSEPTTDLGETVVVHITAPSSFNYLEVTLPQLANQALDGQFTSVATDYTYVHTEDRIGGGPRALRFTASLDNVRVATGELPTIGYTLTDDGQTRQSRAELAVTLTAVTP